MKKNKDVRKIALGSVVAVMASAVIFSGASQAVKGLEMGKKQVVETSYNVLMNGSENSTAPLGYEQHDYEVQFVGKDQPTENDMNMEEAAELASQHLWDIFRINLKGHTLEMNYQPISQVLPRAKWEANLKINENVSYAFILDAVTGESYWIEKRVFHEEEIPEGLNKDLLNNHEEYQQIARGLAEEHQLFSTKLKAIDYVSQGYDKNEINNKNSNITFQLTSEEGKKAQLTISTYNKELLHIGYDGWLTEAERLERRLKENENDDSIHFMITDELMKEVEETNTPIIISQ